MPCVFLSHSSHDKALARRIADDLRLNNIEVWFDEWNIVAGESISGKIQQGLEDADFLAILLTQHSVQSGWVEKEWRSQIWREVQHKKEFIIPLKVDDCPIPTFLRDKKYADFSQDYQRGLQDLLTAIQRLSGQTTPLPLVAPRYLLHHNFLCYAADGAEIALHLYERCKQAGIGAWLDQCDVLESGPAWDQQVLEALQTCHALLLVLTRQSAAECAECAREWKRALSYKKPILVLEAQPALELPFELEGRQRIRLFGSEEKAIEALRQRLDWLNTPPGRLHALQERLADAQRSLRRSRDPLQKTRAQNEIDDLQQEIRRQEQIVADPQGTEQWVKESIARGLERERQPERPSSGRVRSKFINPPPAPVPGYFQDRHVESRLVGDFLKDEARRVLTVVGRAGIGKTAMVCRLLKSLEQGCLPDDLGPQPVSGIVYLSAVGARKLDVPHLFADLCQLLPQDIADDLDQRYRNPQLNTTHKIEALLEALRKEFISSKTNTSPPGRGQGWVPLSDDRHTLATHPQPLPGGEFAISAPIILLLDNFEDLVEMETRDLTDAELDEALRTILNAPAHPLKVIITTRVAPQALALYKPERQQILHLDEGLESPFAENILREMDVDGKVGLKTAPEDLLREAKERTRGYPRALEALFAILSAERDTTLAEVLNATEVLLPDNVVEVLVGEAFNRLDPNAQAVMQGLAVYGRPVNPTAVDYLLQPYLPGVDSASVLKRLVNMQFARKEGGKYYLHPVDRAYALARIAGVPPAEDADRMSEIQEEFTQPALFRRGADYFKQTRQPRETWKTLDDLRPQLAEIELRCAAGEYDTAAEVLSDIDFDYLLLWGYYRLMIALHESLQGKLRNPDLKRRSVGNLGTAYYHIGEAQQAITYYECSLEMAREAENRWGEGSVLGNFGLIYAVLGQATRAIEYYEQALTVAREIGNKQGEGIDLGAAVSTVGIKAPPHIFCLPS